MSAPISAFPFVPKTPPITLAAAESAAAGGGGKRKSLREKSMERLAKKSRRMADEFRESMEKNVKKKLNSMSGPDDNRKRGLKVAQFIPGKGLEVEGVQQHNDDAIYCSLGLKGDKLVNALEKTFDLMSGKKVSMDFAFKMICKPDLSSKVKNSRVTVMNCFRHLNPDSFNYNKTGTFTLPQDNDEIQANRRWHTTLGPDASFVRRAPGETNPGAGTWRGPFNSNYGAMSKEWVPGNPDNDPPLTPYWTETEGKAKIANSLYSPYRYPNDMEVMYSRVNRQVLENYGFSLNKWRFVGSGDAVTTNLPAISSQRVYQLPNSTIMNFPATVDASEEDLKRSFPAYINSELAGKVKTGNQIPSTGGVGADSPFYEYHSQFGPGKLNYQFSNDGTNPVCIDICVVGVKKSEVTAINNMQDIFQYNYLLSKFQNNNRLNVSGYQSSDRVIIDNVSKDTVDFDLAKDEWHADSKLPFVPSECFKNPQNMDDAIGTSDLSSNLGANRVFELLIDGKRNPFKLIKRDQFIVSSGSTRAWNTTLPSMNYRPEVRSTATNPITNIDSYIHKLTPTSDEYTFILMIGASGMSKPVEELFPDQTYDQNGTVRTPEILKSAIIDHEPSSCNVSVVGTYKETVMPSYPVDVDDRSFVNGRLALPYFTLATAPEKIDPTDIQEYPDRLSTVDIATQSQVVRSTASGITGVGAISTQNGA